MDESFFRERNHPLRTSLSEEMHIRKMPHFAAPARLMQIMVQVRDEGADAEQALVHSMLSDAFEGVRHPRYVRGTLHDLHFIWERHTEYSTYTLIRPGDFDPRLDLTPFRSLPLERLGQLPGSVVRATQIAVVAPGSELLKPASVAQLFYEQDLVVCDVAGGTARIWSDFRLHDEGWGKLILEDRGLERSEAASIVQRIQELGNYRNMALLGLPVAQNLTSEVSRLEQELTRVTEALAEERSEDTQLLDAISELSAELARLMADTRYRMSATKAYFDIVHDRLQSLEVSKVKGYPTLVDFTERRLTPAARTCASFSARLEDLAQRAAWTGALLRTRVDTALSQQNRDLLASMDRRTRLQLRLQQTVEGLSVVAISYYAVGLVGFLAAALQTAEPTVSVALLQGVSVPIVVAIVWYAVRRIRRHIGNG